MFYPTQSISQTADSGISPSSVYGSRLSRARHLQWRRASGELSQSLQGRAGMPRPLFDKRTRISNSSVSPGAPGVLRPLVAQPYPCIHTTYRGLRSPLRAVFGLRGSFRTVEEVALPCAPFSEGVNISSGRSRSMAHRRDQISIWNPEEGVRRLAFRVVLYRRHPPSGSYSDWPS